MADEAVLTRTLPVKVYTGEPVSAPGTIVFGNSPGIYGTGGRADVPGIYLMDGETGHVSGPIISIGGELDLVGLGGSVCDAERVIFIGSSQYPRYTFRLYQMDHSGAGLRSLVERSDGLIQDPDLSTTGDIAFIDDTRWNRNKDELAIHTYLGETVYASGARVDALFNGFNPSWSPDGSRIALGSNPISLDGQPEWRLSIFRVDGHGTGCGKVGHQPSRVPFPQ